MALTAATKTARVARLEKTIADHNAVTSNLQAKIACRKTEVAGLLHDLKVLKMVRAVGEVSVPEQGSSPE